MQLKKYLIFGQYLVFFNQIRFANTKALVGSNIRDAKTNEFPSLASIAKVHKKDITHICTGTIISVKDVITAEHCFEGLELNSFNVLVGAIKLGKMKKYDPAWWVTYEMWANQRGVPVQYQDNDIAIIRVTEAISDKFIPIALRLIPPHKLFGSTVTTASWGKLADHRLPSTLKTGLLVVLSKDECERRGLEVSGKKMRVNDSIFCTSADPFLLLHSGDSGCPILYENGLIAISKGSCPMITKDKFHPKKINVHFSVYYYQNFIQDIITNY